MEINFTMLLILCPLVFIAGFIDSIAGGGGLISLPAYLFAGIPPHFAWGTNKFASSFGTTFSTIRFIKSKQIHMKSALIAAASALIGSYIGARAALALDEKYLKYCLIVLIPAIAIFTLTRKGFGEVDTSINLSNKKTIVISILSGFIIGMYDGFFGPGTGTFLIIISTTFLGLDLTKASGNAKIVNLASNIAALAAFIIGGKVMFAVGIPAAACAILGNWIGSGMAIKKGAKVIRPVFICVLVLLLIKIILDLLGVKI